MEVATYGMTSLLYVWGELRGEYKKESRRVGTKEP